MLSPPSQAKDTEENEGTDYDRGGEEGAVERAQPGDVRIVNPDAGTGAFDFRERSPVTELRAARMRALSAALFYRNVEFLCMHIKCL